MNSQQNSLSLLNDEILKASFWLNAGFGDRILNHTPACILYFESNFYTCYGCLSSDDELNKVALE